MITNKDSTKRYVALLSQLGTSNPTAIVLLNNLGVNIVWTRENTGVYFGTLQTGQILPENEVTTAILNTGELAASSLVHISIIRQSNTEVVLQTATQSGAADGILAQTGVAITIYNQYE